MSSLNNCIPKMGLTSNKLQPCTLLFLAASLILLSLLSLYSLFSPHPPNPQTAPSLHSTFLSSADNSTLAAYLRQLTLHPHLAGTPPAFQTALYVKGHFESLHLETHMTNHTALLSYPLSSSLALLFRNDSSLQLELGDTGGRGEVVMPYHAYSPSGRVVGEAVFLNFGRGEDYEEVAAFGVEVRGRVGVVRRGRGMSRSDVVEMAGARGVAAVVMYTEGSVGVERGTVMKGVGDPRTPLRGGEKMDPENEEVVGRFPKVPSMPISVEVAYTILRSLGGRGVPLRWRESLKSSGIGGVGPGPTMLNFSYEVS